VKDRKINRKKSNPLCFSLLIKTKYIEYNFKPSSIPTHTTKHYYLLTMKFSILFISFAALLRGANASSTANSSLNEVEVGRSRTIHNIILDERRFVVYNSRRLTGECLSVCEDKPPTGSPTMMEEFVEQASQAETIPRFDNPTERPSKNPTTASPTEEQLPANGVGPTLEPTSGTRTQAPIETEDDEDISEAESISLSSSSKGSKSSGSGSGSGSKSSKSSDSNSYTSGSGSGSASKGSKSSGSGSGSGSKSSKSSGSNSSTSGSGSGSASGSGSKSSKGRRW
jgi:hypothetical protein